MNDSTRIVVTGHRPDKLRGGYHAAARLRLETFAEQILIQCCGLQRPRPVVYTGMAQGWDQAIASACAALHIPFVAVVPCEGHERLWLQSAQERYKALLGHAAEIRYEPGGPYAAWKMQARNVYMVDQVRPRTADFVLALWNGSPGGTANVMQYAMARQVRVRNMWSFWSGEA